MFGDPAVVAGEVPAGASWREGLQTLKHIWQGSLPSCKLLLAAD